MDAPSPDLAAEAERTVAFLAERGLSCALAESCTGGMAASALVGVPGASAVFAGGVVSYSNEMKISALGVPAGTIAEHGAVSSETAKAMAEGVRRISGAAIAVSTTGVAGPGGGTPGKPVGLVWFGFARDGRATAAESRVFSGTRSEIREAAARRALEILRS